MLTASRSFGIGHVIHTRISRDNLVEVDGDFMARLANKQDYERTVEPRSWAIAQQYARELREKQVKVAFFSLTFHSKPDVHTRHALVRFAHCMGQQGHLPVSSVSSQSVNKQSLFTYP